MRNSDQSVRFHVASLSMRGSHKRANEDAVLAQDEIVTDGRSFHADVDALIAFVADGVGGTRDGGFASRFVIDAIRSRFRPETMLDEENLARLLQEVHESLRSATAVDPERVGSATTLVGICECSAGTLIVAAGDSESHLLRDDMLISLVEPHTLDGSVRGSPLTSWLGGDDEDFKLSVQTAPTLISGDILLLCSDGLLRALKAKQLRALLASSKPLAQRRDELWALLADSDRPDDVSAILIAADSAGATP